MLFLWYHRTTASVFLWSLDGCCTSVLSDPIDFNGFWRQKSICKRRWPQYRGPEVAARTLSRPHPYGDPRSNLAPISQAHWSVPPSPVRRFCISSSFRGHPSCGQHPQSSRWHPFHSVPAGLLRHQDAKMEIYEV